MSTNRAGSVAKTKISRKVECCLEPMCFSFCKPVCNKCLYFMCWGICGPCKTENTKEIKEGAFHLGGNETFSRLDSNDLDVCELTTWRFDSHAHTRALFLSLTHTYARISHTN